MSCIKLTLAIDSLTFNGTHQLSQMDMKGKASH